MTTQTKAASTKTSSTKSSSTQGTKKSAEDAAKTKTKVQLLFGTPYEGESSAAIMACNDYLRMGSGRSVRGLASQYHKTPQNVTPTQSHATLRRWAENYNWRSRAALSDIYEDEIHSAERNKVLSEGFALEYERVKALKQLGQFLRDQIFEQGIESNRKVDVVCPDCDHTVTVTTDDVTNPYHNVWVGDVKQIGTGEKAQRIDIERFNGALISEYRAVMDDLAKETGDRQPVSLSARKLHSLFVKLDIEKLSKEQLAALTRSGGKEWFEVLLESYMCDE